LTTVVALGGNALIRPGDRGTAAEQAARLREAAQSLKPLFAEPRLVITHGNGPQVGNELLRQERAADEVPPLPLYLAVAQTQAEIGSLIEAELGPVAVRPIACLLTHVVVAEDDPAFDRPTKPIGPFYSSEQARTLERERGWTLVKEQGRGWRRAVPSPAPLEVVEVAQIRSLLDSGALPVACGGGGIPVVRRDGRLHGVEAVIDKDRASALLAAALGADRLVILTDVGAVRRGFGTPREEEVRELPVDEAETLLAELAEGSMRPKVEAAIAVARSGGEAIITALDRVDDALAGRAGTRIGM
jgi:carbamate kinase